VEERNPATPHCRRSTAARLERGSAPAVAAPGGSKRPATREKKEAQRRLTAAPGRREASARRWCSATCTQAEERSEEAGTGEEIDGSLPRRTGHVTSDNGGRDGWRVRCFILSAHGGRWPASSLPGRKAAARRGAENSSTAS
jgi:hypothetical protein